RLRQLAPGIGEHGERQRLQIGVLLAPGQVHVVRVDGEAEHLGVAIGEVAAAAAELGDLGGAYEGEVHRPGEQHEPLARVAAVGDGGKLTAIFQADHGGEGERRKLVSYGDHDCSPSHLI